MRDAKGFWYVLKVKKQHELKTVSDLSKMGLEAYTPSVCEWRQWSDRKKKIDKPLISRHVFVQLSAQQEMMVFGASSVLGYLNVHGQRAKVWPNEVERLKQYCKQEYQTEILRPGTTFKAPVLKTDVELIRVDKNKMCSTVSSCGRYNIKFKLAS